MRKATIGSVINNRTLINFSYNHKKQARWSYRCNTCNTVASGSLQNLKVIGCMYCKRNQTKSAMLEALGSIDLKVPMYKWNKIVRARVLGKSMSSETTVVNSGVQP